MDPEQMKEIIIRGNRRLTMNDCELLDKTSREIGAKNLLEIGSMDGCSSMILGLAAKDLGGHLYCIEPNPKGRWYQNISEMELAGSVTLIKGFSPWIDTAQIRLPLDYLFIDGDHRTRWCLADYHFWAPMVRAGGRIAFHDWTGGKGVGAWVQRAVGIILEDEKLTEIARHEGSNRGIIIFEKEE